MEGDAEADKGEGELTGTTAGQGLAGGESPGSPFKWQTKVVGGDPWKTKALKPESVFS